MGMSKNCKEKEIQAILLKWYVKNKRILPWRKLNANKLPNPYYILVSEYMLQQTTVETVKKRFNEFILQWPSLNALSKSSKSKILKFWAGLGYYSRATNLLESSKIIKKKYKSKVPKNYNDLIKLPGVGDYTAKAILGIAYNQPIMPIDANIERILARLYALKLPPKKIKSTLINKSNNFISKKFSTNFIQALMDYGSLICTPRNPNCKKCLLKNKCISFKKNLENNIPVRIKSRNKKKKKYTRAYIFYNEKNEILVRKRSPKGMLASMLEVPNDCWAINKSKLIQDDIVINIKNKMQSKGSIEYSFSHFNLETEIFFTKVKKCYFSGSKWIKKNSINKSGLPTLMKKIIEAGI